MLPVSCRLSSTCEQERQKERSNGKYHLSTKHAMYNAQQQYTRWRAVFPGNARTSAHDWRRVLTLRLKTCSLFTLFTKFISLAGKLGQICTFFEVKRRKSASIIGIDHSCLGKSLPIWLLLLIPCKLAYFSGWLPSPSIIPRRIATKHSVISSHINLCSKWEGRHNTATARCCGVG